ncbi:MAG: AMP-dependent synthetase/ligase [Anaerovoracaceae bacterium]|jgi:long-chain acyl-CoA synthetase
MNSIKYKDALYEPRRLDDLRDLIKSSTRIWGDKPAFLVKDDHKEPFRPISFRQWDRTVDALGTALIDLGLKDKKIAVIGENSYQWVTTYFATVNGTGVIVPIDRELKPPEIANLLNRAQVSALVISKKMRPVIAEVLPLLEQPLEYLIDMAAAEDSSEATSWNRLVERGERLLDDGDRRFLDAPIDRGAMCSLLFTSGTTGLAKGVMLSHRSIASNVYNMSKYVNVDGYVGLSVLPMHHTYEMTCHVCTGLFQGFTLVVCEGLKYILANMREAHVTIMLAVPLIYENIHRRIMINARKQGKLPRLQRAIALSKKLHLYNHPKICRRLFHEIHEQTGGHIVQFIAGGAAIDPKVVEDFEAMGFPFIQGYGMTEYSPIIAVNKDRYSKADAAGLPMPETEIKIVDPDADGIGEIYCKGESTMVGYYNNPEQTAEAFDGEWLKTGDYGSFDEDGFLHVAGRKKNVIVTKNGKNVFPEEVEYYLQQSDFIEEVLVHGVEDDRTGDTVIKAEVYPSYHNIEMTVGVQDEEGLRALLKDEIDRANEQMPLYKRVRRFDIRKEEFSKTTTRKIKRYTDVNMDKGEGTKC